MVGAVLEELYLDGVIFAYDIPRKVSYSKQDQWIRPHDLRLLYPADTGEGIGLLDAVLIDIDVSIFGD
jgi:hypothetical protein